MSETRFTPGPWRVVHSDGDVYVRDSGGLIAKGTKPHLYEGQDARFTEELGQYVANAALIAAAPTLFHALSDLLNAHHHSRGDEYVDAAYAALDLARGKT